MKFEDFRRYVIDVCLKHNQECRVYVTHQGDDDEFEVLEVKEIHDNGTACFHMVVEPR